MVIQKICKNLISKQNKLALRREKEERSFEGENDDTILSTGNNRAKTENYVRVESFPCSTQPLPLKNIKVELVQNCNSDVSIRNIFSNMFRGGCSPLKLFIRQLFQIHHSIANKRNYSLQNLDAFETILLLVEKFKNIAIIIFLR